ncbi:YdhK family protein [Niallia nealsonii]|uniref:DUF1541 domain-containing protein n=1 Tax=Niallia nealsonii TaxID=115979 RepID=A0A2N0Z2K4_9BACI|nr:YdhK family protein [Niallia nealsonii]PKG23746.1 hypothetical protein CWS01_10425 [Niallia nealsonii]
MKKIAVAFIAILFVFSIIACTDNKKETETSSENEHTHTNSAELPDNLEPAKSPTYMDGSSIIIEADHMEGMKGAEATVLSSFDTTAYVVSYTPTNGGKRVDNHKWVIQEEMEDAGHKTLAPGTKVTLLADHMEGMKGATAEIESSEKTTVYMVDYTPTNGGKKVTNHKWVTEEEIKAK